MLKYGRSKDYDRLTGRCVGLSDPNPEIRLQNIIAIIMEEDGHRRSRQTICVSEDRT